MSEEAVDTHAPALSKAQRPQAASILHSSTLRLPQWTYFHLRLFTLSTESPAHDAVTARKNLNTAMMRYLGIIGSSISIDILKLDNLDLWVRVPRESGGAFHEAVSAWIGQGDMKYLVKAKDDWLVKLSDSNGQDMF
ncbi:hypothetical protein BT63DRAFT_195859 [Microthyrium microscopicum]|uniref:Ribonucleases P/MRP subunit Pop8-like domain-containing protein n=1 Tax=Microthyrium microscopicum TaxID=703497 RepID=A0A6A6UKY0_9PEZI|nr:hypothetical protein BT63DRAFT_195859 [Microthyrium microscopicum]